jgi:hypothetical protein
MLLEVFTHMGRDRIRKHKVGNSEVEMERFQRNTH